jgi:hypothetical protein
LHAAETRQIGSLGPENSLHGRPNDAAILVDDARKRAAPSEVATRSLSSLTELQPPRRRKDLDLIALHDAMKRLASVDPGQCQIVELPFFGSLSVEETAEVVQISPATTGRESTTARHWLHHAISGGAEL